MDFVLTEHAKKRCIRRKVRPEWVAAALARPARMACDDDDPSLMHALLPIPDRGFRVLRVIYNETTEPVSVVTVYFDDEVHDL
ncbi:MAG: DUF4258 domain-containing protein [Rhodocyclaceae bacterium]|nr:DUF4258 domain-containing protein [Rhodocyclaceae bacterium]